MRSRFFEVLSHPFTRALRMKFSKTQFPTSDYLACKNQTWEMKYDFFQKIHGMTVRHRSWGGQTGCARGRNCALVGGHVCSGWKGAVQPDPARHSQWKMFESEGSTAASGMLLLLESWIDYRAPGKMWLRNAQNRSPSCALQLRFFKLSLLLVVLSAWGLNCICILLPAT